MTIKIQSTSETEYRDFLSTLKQSATLLEQFAIVQAAVGGLSMSNRAGTTFNVVASLENYILQIENEARRAEAMLRGTGAVIR